MARFQLLEAHVFGAVRLKAGSTIADTAANALPGDKIVTTLSSATVGPTFKPLDATATTMKNNSIYASANIPATISGVQSVDA